MSDNPNAGAYDNPIGAGYFTVEVQGLQVAQFREASGFENTTEVITQIAQDAKGQRVYQKIPGNTKWGDINLKRGFTNDDTLWNWRQSVLDGKMSDARKTVTITGYDTEGNPKLQFVAQRAWISSWKGGSFNAKTSDVAVEEIVLVHEGLDRKKV